MLFAALSMLVAATAGIAAYVAWPRPDGPRHQQVARSGSSAPAPTPAPQPPKPRDDERARQEREEAERRKEARRAAEQERMRREAERRQEEARQQALQREAERKKAEAEQAERQQEEARRMKEEAEKAEADRARAAAAVDRDLRDAYVAIRARDYARASQVVDEAEKRAGEDGDLVTRCGRWRLLIDYAAELADFEQQAIMSANEGREYQIGKRLIGIVEITPKTYAFKEQGQLKRGPRSAMPKAIERAILEQWFAGKDQPANHIYLGIQRLLEEPPDLAAVRKEWKTALAGEPATRSIMPLLEDPILTGDRQ